MISLAVGVVVGGHGVGPGHLAIRHATGLGGRRIRVRDLGVGHDLVNGAATIGMTFQVSDTDLTRKEIRATAVRQALLSYLFEAIIIAATIYLVAGRAK